MSRHRRPGRPEAALTVAVPSEPRPGQWVVGRCWLGCGASARPVVWVGRASLWGPDTPHAEAPLYGCAECLARLAAMAREDQARCDVDTAAVTRERR